MNQDIELARRLAAAVAEAGGRAYFVGGYVRDAVRGCENKDIDIEVHGLTPAQLEAVLDRLGERTAMGASFGVYGLRHHHLDIAMPRSETATGRGHRDFAVSVDPFLGTHKAARRRDFTINALMQDVLTGEIIDPFGGLCDLRAGLIRHVCADSFVEDPLRALRAAQFAARFGFAVAPDTVRLCAGMNLSALACERVMDELAKALLKADRPSVFFAVLRRMDQLRVWFPEIAALSSLPQDPRYHPEGDVYTHTMLVLDQAATLRARAAYPLGLMMAALCHDLGKLRTTRMIDGHICSPEHEAAGVPLAEQFIARLSSEARLRKYVANMVALHGLPNVLCYTNAEPDAFMPVLDRSAEPDDLLLLAKADHCGRTGHADDYAAIEQRLKDALALYRTRMALPAISGADLIAAGLRPGKALGEALAFAHQLHLRGVPKEAALAQTLDRL